MKILFLNILFLFLSVGLWAQDTYTGPATTKSTVFFVQPLSLAVGGGELGVEHLYAKNKTLRVQLGYFTRQNFIIYNGSYEGFRAELQHRFYLNDRPIKGNFNDLYISPYLQYKQIEISNFFGPNDLATASGIGLLLGYQKMMRKNITLDFFTGGGLVSPIISRGVNRAHIPIVNPYLRGIYIRFGFACGIAL